MGSSSVSILQFDSLLSANEFHRAFFKDRVKVGDKAEDEKLFFVEFSWQGQKTFQVGHVVWCW